MVPKGLALRPQLNNSAAHHYRPWKIFLPQCPVFQGIVYGKPVAWFSFIRALCKGVERLWHDSFLDAGKRYQGYPAWICTHHTVVNFKVFLCSLGYQKPLTEVGLFLSFFWYVFEIRTLKKQAIIWGEPRYQQVEGRAKPSVRCGRARGAQVWIAASPELLLGGTGAFLGWDLGNTHQQLQVLHKGFWHPRGGWSWLEYQATLHKFKQLPAWNLCMRRLVSWHLTFFGYFDVTPGRSAQVVRSGDGRPFPQRRPQRPPHQLAPRRFRTYVLLYYRGFMQVLSQTSWRKWKLSNGACHELEIALKVDLPNSWFFFSHVHNNWKPLIHVKSGHTSHSLRCSYSLVSISIHFCKHNLQSHQGFASQWWNTVNCEARIWIVRQNRTIFLLHTRVFEELVLNNLMQGFHLPRFWPCPT